MGAEEIFPAPGTRAKEESGLWPQRAVGLRQPHKIPGKGVLSRPTGNSHSNWGLVQKSEAGPASEYPKKCISCRPVLPKLQSGPESRFITS